MGFAEKTGACATDSINSIKNYGISNSNSRTEIGRLSNFEIWGLFLIINQRNMRKRIKLIVNMTNVSFLFLLYNR